MGFSHWELAIFALVVLLLFGGSRLPSLMRNMGRSVTEFKKGMHGLESDEDSSEKSEKNEQEKEKEKVEA